MDVLAGYANTLGVFVTNETVNSAQALGAGAAAVVRAAARDVRKYAALIAAASEDALGRRVLPVGVNSADVSILQRSQFDYYTAALSEDEGGDADGAIDFYAVSRSSFGRRKNPHVIRNRKLTFLGLSSQYTVQLIQVGGAVEHEDVRIR